jgi:DNA-binding transcriptional regulator YhcF (GntR family)
MVKKKTKKKKERKHQTPLDKIKKQLDKLEALHAKEEAIVENITDIIDDAQFDEQDYDFHKWEGTD